MKKLCVIAGIVLGLSGSAFSADLIDRVMYWADTNGVAVTKAQVTLVNGGFVRWGVTNTPPTQAQLDAIADATVDSWRQDTRPTRPLEQVFMARYAELQTFMGTNLSVSVPFSVGDSLIIEQDLHDYTIDEATAAQAKDVNSLATSLLFLWNAITSIDPAAMYTSYFGQ